MYDESFIWTRKCYLILLLFSTTYSDVAYPSCFDLLCLKNDQCSDAGWNVGGGGCRSRENLAIITKDFEKSSIVLQKVGGMPCVNFLLASNTLFSPSILSLSINPSDSISASRGENKHVHVELEMKDRNVIMLLLLPSFLLCFPNWAEIEKKIGEKDHKFKNQAGAKNKQYKFDLNKTSRFPQPIYRQP